MLEFFQYNYLPQHCKNHETIYKKYRADFGEKIAEISMFRSTKLSQMMQQLQNVVTRLV